MKKDQHFKKIQAKFTDLISLDEEKRAEIAREASKDNLFKRVLKETLREGFTAPTEIKTNYRQVLKEENEELILTKSDICKEVSKLKPYLGIFKDSIPTVEMQDIASKEISDQEKNCMSDLIIHYNKKLCQRLRQNARIAEKREMKRISKQKQGWIFQVYYRHAATLQTNLSSVTFNNGYVVLSQILELFPNLTFESGLFKININEVKRIKYFQEREFQVIQIRYNQNESLQIGFLNDKQLKLFDRLLFLIRNMARTSSSRLFQNQLLRNIYSEF